MVRIGVSDLHVFQMEDELDGVATYQAPVRLAKLINVGITQTVAEAELYADDGLDEYVAELTGQEVTINPKDISPEHEALLLGKETDSIGGVVDGVIKNVPYFAVAFRSQKSDGTYQYRVLYKVRFRPFDETYDTKGSSVTFQSPTISGRALKRDDGRFGYKVDETEQNSSQLDSFFQNVFEPIPGA